jgi:molybdopterin-guanine dinucleotide biosynthesis protein MobB
MKPILSIVAPSGTGKTTLLEDVIRSLVAAGKRVAVLKASHEDHYLDVPGKDSHRFAGAGAPIVGLVGPGVTTLFVAAGHRAGAWPGTTAVAAWIASCPLFHFDLVLCEGFSFDPALPKLRVVRGAWPSGALTDGRTTGDLVAVAWDGGGRPDGLDERIPVLPLNGPAVARWITAWAAG